MEKAVQERFHQILLEKQVALAALVEVNSDAGDVVDLDQTRVGRLSRMDALQSQAMSRETARRRADDLLRVEAALKRISSGDFGYCLACDEPIAIKRLEVDPSLATCVNCAPGAG